MEPNIVINESSNLSTLIGGGAIIVTLLFLFKGNFSGILAKIFKANSEKTKQELTNLISEQKTKETNIKVIEAIMENDKEKMSSIVEDLKKELIVITDNTKKDNLEAFKQW